MPPLDVPSSAGPSLGTIAAFAAALEAEERSTPSCARVVHGDVASRFAVYRNNVWVARLEAVAALFPVLARLVGDEFLAGLTRRFFAEGPPTSPVIHEWATPFVAWARASEDLAEWPWIADVAALEAAWLAAHDAEDATPLAPADLAGLSPARLATSRARLHPSLTLLASPFAVGSIWAAHQGDAVPDDVDADAPETVLVARPDADVHVVVLAPAEAAFVTALVAGASVIDAAEAALDVDPVFDVGERLTALVRLGAIVAFV